MSQLQNISSGWEISITTPETISPSLESLPNPSTITVTNKSDVHQNYSYKVNFVKNIAYPICCNEERWNILNKNVKYRSTDVIICTYPKCGTTWAEQCTLLLLNKGDKSLLNPSHKNVYRPIDKDNHVGKIWPEACIEQNPEIQLKAGAEEFAPITWEEWENAPLE